MPRLPAILLHTLWHAACVCTADPNSGGPGLDAAKLKARAERFGARWRRFEVGIAADRRLLLAGGLVLIELAAVLTTGRPFRRLRGARAAVWFEQLGLSRFALLRRAQRGVKMLAQFLWFADGEAWAAMGYDGPWLGRVAVDVAPSVRIGVDA